MTTLVLVGKIVGTAALAGGALVTGVTATGSSPVAADDSSPAKVRCARFPGANDALEKKLHEIRDLPKGDERRKAALEVRKDVRSGEYGPKSQVASYRLEVRRLRLVAKAPDALKADLATARKKPAGDARRDAVQATWKAASAGKYGDGVQKVAKRAVARAEACADRSKQKSS